MHAGVRARSPIALLALVLALFALLTTTVQTAHAAPAKESYTLAYDPAHPLPIGTYIGTKAELQAKAGSQQAPTPPTLHDTGEKAAVAQSAKAAAIPAPAGMAAASGDNRAPTLDYCRSLYPNPSSPISAQLSRWGWCFVGTCGYYSLTDGIVTGVTTYRCTIAGRGQTDDRHVLFDIGFDNFQDVGLVLVDTDLVVGWTAAGYSGDDGSNGPCSLVYSAPTRKLLWQLGMTGTAEVWDTDSNGYGDDKISRCTAQANAHSDIPIWGEIASKPVRLDSATYIPGQPTAGLFPDTIGSMNAYSRTNPAHAAVALHIYDAQATPVYTRPAKADKAIPGGVASGQPLHRLYPRPGSAEETRYKLNRSTVSTTCDQEFGTLDTDLQCDEYPFASSYEGAGYANGNFSVRPVPKTQNLSAGGSLVAYYNSDRILNGDPYWVEIG